MKIYATLLTEISVFLMINLGSLLDGGGERKLTKKRSKTLEVRGKHGV